MKRQEIEMFFLPDDDNDDDDFDPVVLVELTDGRTLTGYIYGWNTEREDCITFSDESTDFMGFMSRNIIKHIRWLNIPKDMG